MKYLIPLCLAMSLVACSGGGGKKTPTISEDPPLRVNTAPNAVNDNASTNNGQSVIINVLSNDSDAENNTLTISTITQPANGTVSIENNALIYTPRSASFAGSETFSYVVSDSKATATAQVDVNVSQYISFNGILIGADTTRAPQVRMSIGSETFESGVDTQNRFAFDYETSTVDARDVVFTALVDGKLIFTSKTLAFSDIVSRRGTAVLVSFDSFNELVLSPLSTAIEALALRYDTQDQRSFEDQIDADTLLQIAAINSLIVNGELSADGNMMDILNDDALLESMAQSLLLGDEIVSRSSENINGVEGTIVVGSRLSSAIETVRSSVAPYSSFNGSSQTQTEASGKQQNLSDETKKQTVTTRNEGVLYDFYQLKPSYQGRVASYNFIGAQLTLMEDGTGTYWAEFGTSPVTWEEQADELLVTLSTPIIYNARYSKFDLQLYGLIDPSVYAQIRNIIDGDVFTTYINSFSLTRLFDGESVDIASTTFDINVVMDTDVEFFEEAQALGVDNYVTPLSQNLEYTQTSEETYFPFEDQEMPGAWGFAVAASADSQSRADNAVLFESVFADFVTFNVNGTMQSQFHSVNGTWSITDGILTVLQDDGWTVDYTRIAQDQQAYGMLIRATNEEEGKSFSQYRMAVKQSSTEISLATIKDDSVLWNGNWSLANPNNYNADGTLKSTGYYGFQFSNGEAPLSFLLGFLYRLGAEVELIIRNRPRYLVRNEDDIVTIERRTFIGQGSTNAQCDLTESGCITFWKREWTPLGQTEDRVYVLEHFLFNLDLLDQENPDATLYRQPRGRVLFYEKVAYPEGLLNQE